MSAGPSSPTFIEGAVTDTRHRGRFFFFAGLRDTSGSVLQCLFRGEQQGGRMGNDEVRQLKQQLRPGDTVSAEVFEIEPPGTDGRGPCYHIAKARIVSMNVKSNTGIQRDVAPGVEEAEQGSNPLGAVEGRSQFSGKKTKRPPKAPRSTLHNGHEAGYEAEAGHEASAASEAADDDAPPAKRAAPNGRDGAKHNHCSERASIFGQWVIDNFGAAVRASGKEVLDVAGGKGELSLYLTLGGLKCTLVDPRESSGFLSHRQRKQLRRSGLPPFEVVREEFVAGSALATRAALVLGMHPDEVTEAIVDAAIASRAPFAVVPCCVFSRLFPFRMLPSGAPVRTHAQLCEYLAHKHPNAQTARLPFAGQNTVVYLSSYQELQQGAAGGGLEGGAGGLRCEPCEEQEAAGGEEAPADATPAPTTGE